MIKATPEEIAEWQARPAEEKARAFIDYLIVCNVISRGDDETYEANVKRLADQFGSVEWPTR